MFKDLKLTLYDFFGYLLPGGVLLAGLSILFWNIFNPLRPMRLIPLNLESWVVVTFLAYLSGHMASAITYVIGENERFKRLASLFPPNHTILSALPKEMTDAARSKACTVLGLASKVINDERLYGICDQTLEESGSTEGRVVFQYREGFYRGMTISLSAFLFLLP